MRRLIALVCAGLSVALLTGAGQPAPQRLYQAYSDEQKAALDRVSAYLNSMHTLKSGFIQIGPNGESDEGDIYIAKPGQVRFDYHAPSPVLIVATGGSVYVKNARLNTVDRYDLSDTPLGLLLNAQVDLKTNKAVIGVQEQDGGIIVNARTSTNRNNSNITLVFAAQPMELRQWTVRDNQNGTTTVALRGLQPGAAIADGTFAVPVKTPSIKAGR
jgi:outer membrane lipoprotein-sorting protein